MIDERTAEVGWRLPNDQPLFPVRDAALTEARVETRTRVESSVIAVVVDDDGVLHLYDASSQSDPVIPIPQTLVEPGWTPIAVDDTVIVLQTNGRLLALDAVSRVERWNREVTAPVAAETDGHVFLFSDESGVRALRAKTGQELWEVACDDVSDDHLAVSQSAIVVAGDAGIMLFERPDATPLPPLTAPDTSGIDTTPEVVVERFMDAWKGGDRITAEGLLAASFRPSIVGGGSSRWGGHPPTRTCCGRGGTTTTR